MRFLSFIPSNLQTFLNKFKYKTFVQLFQLILKVRERERKHNATFINKNINVYLLFSIVVVVVLVVVIIIITIVVLTNKNRKIIQYLKLYALLFKYTLFKNNIC